MGGFPVSLSSGQDHLAARGRGPWTVGLAVAEHGEQDVDASAGQADQGSVVSSSFNALAVVVGAAGGVAQRREGGQEQR